MLCRASIFPIFYCFHFEIDGRSSYVSVCVFMMYLMYLIFLRSAQVSAAEPESKLVFGVGFQYAQEGNGPISVASICKGGSAEQQTKIQVGDEIEAVEEISVMGKTIAELNLLLRGEIGSNVNMRLRRSKNDGTVMSYDVSLMRGQAEAFLMRERQRLHAQLENDRKQLNFAQVSAMLYSSFWSYSSTSDRS